MSAHPFYQWLRHFGITCGLALILSLAALWNGQPFFYPDTPTYLRGAEMGVTRVLGSAALKPWLPVRKQMEKEKGSPSTPVTATEATEAEASVVRPLKPLTSIADNVVLAGRSVYYGALLYAGYLSGNMWLTVAFQALCVAYVLQLLMARLWELGTVQVVGVVAALSLLTPLGIYTGFLMPDVFASLVILTMGMLAVYWQELPRIHRWVLSALLLFSLCAHASHLALAVPLLGILLAARLLAPRWRGLPAASLAAFALCIVGALGAEWAFNKAVTASIGAPPLRLPHPMARLIDLGPGTAYLKQHCSESGTVSYAACAYVQNYPTIWDDFLFSNDPAKGAFALADARTKRRMSDEQLRFVVDVFRFDPMGVAGGIALDVLRQLGLFRVDIGRYNQHGLSMYEGRVPDSIFSDMQSSRAANQSPLNQWLTVATYALVLGSMALLVLWRLQRADSTAGAAGASLSQRRLADFVWIVVLGVIGNAVVCATLASSMDRFQARVVWLLPFIALAMLARMAQSTARHSSISDESSGDSAVAAPSPHSLHSSPSSIQGTTP